MKDWTCTNPTSADHYDSRQQRQPVHYYFYRRSHTRCERTCCPCSRRIKIGPHAVVAGAAVVALPKPATSLLPLHKSPPLPQGGYVDRLTKCVASRFVTDEQFIRNTFLLRFRSSLVSKQYRFSDLAPVGACSTLLDAPRRPQAERGGPQTETH